MRTRRPVLTTTAAAAALLLGAAGAQAGGLVSAAGSGTEVATAVVSFDESSPTTGNPCSPDSDRAFETISMTVSADGDYTFRDARFKGTSIDNLSYFAVSADDSTPECLDLTESFDSGDFSFNPFVPLQSGVSYEIVAELGSFSDFEVISDQELAFFGTPVEGTAGTITFDGIVDVDSPTPVGDHEVTGNGTTLAAIDYTLDASSPTATGFGRDGARPCDDIGELPGETAYETVRLQVSQNGDYRFRSAHTTGRFDVFGYAAIHEGEVDGPDGPGCIETTDANESVELESGTTYTLFLAAVDEQDFDDSPVSALGRFVFSVTPNDPFDGLVTFLPVEAEVIDESVVCAKGGPVPAGYGEAIEGSSRNETLVGTPGNDVIRGFGGNDTIRGLGGDDILCGGAGNDTLDGGDGEDVLFGEAGNDTLSGGAADDVLVGGPGNDLLNGGAGTDVGFDLVGNNTFRLIESRVLPENVVAR